jgi:hypothetical protein
LHLDPLPLPTRNEFDRADGTQRSLNGSDVQPLSDLHHSTSPQEDRLKNVTSSGAPVSPEHIHNAKHLDLIEPAVLTVSEPADRVLERELTPTATSASVVKDISEIPGTHLPVRPQRSRSRSLSSTGLENGLVIANDGISSAELGSKIDEHMDDNFTSTLEDACPNQRTDEGSVRSLELSVHSLPVESTSWSPGTDLVSGLENEPVLFYAFPERKWFRSIVFAGVGFVVMTMMVLGNLIYTWSLHSLTC